MPRSFGGWVPYVPVAARRRTAERELAKLRKKGAVISPVKIEGRRIARTFWGKAWCDNLESYRDYENRLPRGRTYVRNGSVVDLQIAPREITAMVSGSEIYKVKVSIADVAQARWKTLCADCSGGIDSLVELLQGRFSKGVMERLCRQDTGLFPRPSEIRFTCSCSDYASMCKHIAAVLYGVGARLDESPELLFRLRAVDETELLSDLGSALLDTRTKRDTAQTLVDDDLAALFGLDMEESEVPAPSRRTDAVSAGPRKKTRKTVIANTAAAPAAEAKTKAAKFAREKKAGSDKQGRRPTAKTPTKAMSVHGAQKNTMAPTRPAPKKTVASPTKSVARLAIAKPSTGMRKVQAKTTVSAHRRSDPNPVIAAAVPVQAPSRRPVRSDVPKPAGRKARPTSSSSSVRSSSAEADDHDPG
jgi:uncharacterized Zn finger protein